VLAGAGFGDDAFFAEAFGEQDLAEGVVDLVGAGVEQVLALEVDFGAAEFFGPAFGEIERGRAADVVVQQVVELGLERGIVFGGALGRRRSRVPERVRHQGFRDEHAAELAEVQIPVRFLVLAGLSAPLAAADVNSTGVQTAGQSWDTPSGWSDALAPAAGNDYFILNGHTIRTPEATGNFTFPGDTLTINTGGTLALKNRSTIIVNLLGGGGLISHFSTSQTPDISRIGGTVDLSGGNLTMLGGAGRTIELLADVSGAGTLVKNGANTLVLAGSNSFGSGVMEFGATGVDRGHIQLASSTALGNHSGIRLLGAQTGGVSGLNLTGGITIAQDLFSAGRSNPETTGYALRNLAGNNSWTGAITIDNGGGAYGFVSDAGTLTLAGTLTSTLNEVSLSARGLQFSGAGNFLVSGDILKGGPATSQDLAVLKGGAGTLTLSGANDYGAATTVNGGTLVAASAAALAGTSGVTVNNAGSVLRVNFGGSGELADAGLAALLAKTTFTNAAAGLVIDTSNAAGDALFSGALAMNANFAKSGAGTLLLTAANSYGGTTTLAGGTLRLSGGNNRLPAGTSLAFTGSSTLDVTNTAQTLAALTTPDQANVALAVAGVGGSLLVNGAQNLQIGPGGTAANPVTTAHAVSLDLAGLTSFTYDNPAGVFRVGLKGGAQNSGALGQVATARLADDSTITAATLAVGDVSANNSGGSSSLALGEETALRVGAINIGYSGRSNANLAFATGLTAPAVTIRNTDGSSPVGDWRVGNVANFSTAAWTDTVDFSGGTVDARVTAMQVGTADIGSQTGRAGTQNSSFILGAGSFEVATLTVGRIAGSGTSTVTNTLAANGTFTLGDAGGTLKAGTLTLAENTILAGGAGARSVSGTFNLAAGTLEASLVRRGAQSGNASATTAFNWTSGTIRNTPAGDLVVENVPLNLLPGSHVFEATGSNRITVDAGSPVGGSGGLEKAGSGSLVLAAANSYSGGTTVAAGLLVVAAGGSLPASTAVTVAGGAVLQVDGAVDGSLTLAAAATLTGTGSIGGAAAINGIHAPGASPGIQTFSGGLGYAASAVLQWDFAGNSLTVAGSDYDQVAVTGGDLDITAGATLALLASGVNYGDSLWSAPRGFTVVAFSGGGTSSGQFTWIPRGPAASLLTVRGRRPTTAATSLPAGRPSPSQPPACWCWPPRPWQPAAAARRAPESGDPASAPPSRLHGHRPAGKLGGAGLGGFGEARPAFEGDLAGGFVEADDAVAVGPAGVAGRFLAGVRLPGLDVFAAWRGVGVGDHGDFVVEAVEVVAGPGQHGTRHRVGARLLVFRPPPAAVIGVDDRRDHKGPRAVAEIIDAVLDHRGQVLVAGNVDGAGLADQFERAAAAGLRPAVRVEVGVQPVVGAAVEVRAAAKPGLRQDRLHRHAIAAAGPFGEEFFLPPAQ
jgi:autotransporter-associated beta strand protein